MKLKSILMLLLTLLVGAPAAFAQGLPAPILHLSFDDIDTTGTVREFRNQGSLGGTFSMMTNGGQVVVETVNEVKAVSFPGGSVGMESDFPVPASLLGNNPWTFHVRVLNPQIGGEEYIIHWGRRNGPDGTNGAIAYGTNGSFGAVQHWGGPDMGYDGGVPAANQWHNIVVTYDGGTEIIYVDGAVNATEGDKTLNIGGSAGALTFYVGRAREGGQPFTGTLALVQTFSQALPADQATQLSLGNNPVGLPVPLLRLDAGALPDGDLTQWTNTGSLGGTFNVAGNELPFVDEVDGVKGLTLTGLSGYISDNVVPPMVQGNNPFTVFYRAYNPAVPVPSSEEPLLEWAPRNGPDGTYAYVGMGNNTTWGAAAHWGAPDMGFATYPAPGEWHDIAVVFDGAQERIYVDGVLDSSEDKTLNIHIGATAGGSNPYFFRVGTTQNGEFRATLTLAVLEMFTVALTEDEIARLPAGPIVIPNAVRNWTLFD